MTWKDAHARGKLPVLKEVSPKLYCSQGKFWLSFRRSMFQSIEFQTQAFLAAVVVELALNGRPVREAGRLPWVTIDLWNYLLWQKGNILSCHLSVQVILTSLWSGLTEMTALQLERRISMGEWAQGRVTLGENVEQDEVHLIVWIMINHLNLAQFVETWHCQSSFRWLAPWRRRRWPGWEWTTGVFQMSCHWPSVSKLTLKNLLRCLCDCQSQSFLCNL